MIATQNDSGRDPDCIEYTICTPSGNVTNCLSYEQNCPDNEEYVLSGDQGDFQHDALGISTKSEYQIDRICSTPEL